GGGAASGGARLRSRSPKRGLRRIRRSLRAGCRSPRIRAEPLRPRRPRHAGPRHPRLSPHRAARPDDPGALPAGGLAGVFRARHDGGDLAGALAPVRGLARRQRRLGLWAAAAAIRGRTAILGRASRRSRPSPLALRPAYARRRSARFRRPLGPRSAWRKAALSNRLSCVFKDLFRSFGENATANESDLRRAPLPPPWPGPPALTCRAERRPPTRVPSIDDEASMPRRPFVM